MESLKKLLEQLIYIRPNAGTIQVRTSLSTQKKMGKKDKK